MENFSHPDTKHLLHTTVGLLNFLGGVFTTQDLEKRTFSDVVDIILKNGGGLTIGIENKKISFGSSQQK